MAKHCIDITPEAKEEFRAYSTGDRNEAEDAGGHVRRLRKMSADGLPSGCYPKATQDSHSLYVFYGHSLKMYVAKREQLLVVVHFAEIGTPHRDSIAEGVAMRRMKEWFGL